MKLRTNADYAHEADLLGVAVACLESDLEQALYENHAPAKITQARQALARAKRRSLDFTKMHWDKIIAASHL